jgi:nitric oxide reductase NorE protein
MQALGSVRLDRAEMASRHLTGAICCGAMFLCVKIFEYWDKFSHDLFPTTNDFFTFYFVLTMIHLVHLIVGTVALANLRRGDRGHLPSRTYAGSRVRGDLLASCGSLVDLSFALLYLLR